MSKHTGASSRRKFLSDLLRAGSAVTTLAAFSALGVSRQALAYASGQPALALVATSPSHLWNAVTLTQSGRIFVGLPRWPGYLETPSVAELLSDGSLKPYPGGGFNDWQPGADPTHAFVCVNALHCFDGRHLWAVDTGAVPLTPPPSVPGAQKLVKIDTQTDRVVKMYTFENVLPPGASLNDLRIGGDKIYLTESGKGSIVIVDTKTGHITRRLADDPSTKASPSRPQMAPSGRIQTQPDGKLQTTNADPIELSPDHQWLYYQAASGPLYRVPTAALNDTTLSEAALSKRVEYVYDTPTLGGTAMDDRGNLFLAETERPRISALAPDGTLRTVIEDDRLWGADALFITADRQLYIPLSQSANVQFAQGPGGKDQTTRPFKIFSMKLPPRYGGPVKA